VARDAETSGGLERLAPLAGVAAVALWLAAVVFDEIVADRPVAADAVAALAYYRDDHLVIWVASALWGLGLVAYVSFLVTLRATLEQHGAPRGATTTGMYCGIAHAVLLGGLVAPDASAALVAGDDGFTAETALAVWSVGYGFVTMGSYLLVGVVLATAIAIRRTGVFPAWLGWASIGIAIVLPLGLVGMGAHLFAMPVWILAVSVLMYRASRGGAPASA
jgi:hypothetical protein